MRARPVRAVAAAVFAATVVLLGGCATEQQAPTLTGAQESLPPPVLAEAGHGGAPVRLTLGGDSAQILAVETDQDGVLLPPKEIDQLGWWAGSAEPGSGTGTVVVTGHVDDIDLGTGFAAHFTSLKPGDTVTLTSNDQSAHRYRVTRAGAVAKEGGLPVDELNRLDGPETLALVTCGGPFVGPPLGYRDNIVVFAAPD